MGICSGCSRSTSCTISYTLASVSGGLAAYTNISRARGFARGLAVFYGFLTIIGLIPGLNILFGLAPLFGHDIWLHALTAIVAAYYGWKTPVEMPPSTRQRL
jgi:hypothetical protein